MTKGKRLLSKVTSYSELFSSAGNIYRSAILFLLSEKPQTPSQIAKQIHISQPLVVHHLLLLKKSGWVTTERIGLHVFYTIKKSALHHIQSFTEKLLPGRNTT